MFLNTKRICTWGFRGELTWVLWLQLAKTNWKYENASSGWKLPLTIPKQGLGIQHIPDTELYYVRKMPLKSCQKAQTLESESMLHAWNVKEMHMRFDFLDTPLPLGLKEVPCLYEKILKNTDISVISTMLCPCPATQYHVAIKTEAFCRFPSLPSTFNLKSFFFSFLVRQAW